MLRHCKKYLCVVCKKQCKQNKIECSACNQWVHKNCVPLGDDLFTEWSGDGLHFICKSCAHVNGVYNFKGALSRLQTSCEDSLYIQAKGELLLLKTYDVNLPQRVQPGLQVGKEDTASTAILRKFHPVLLLDILPLNVLGDGNCFFRALSMGLFGQDSSHDFLRLITALEFCLHRDFYDPSSEQCKKLINDSRVFVPQYSDALSEVCTLGGSVSGVRSYVEMVHIFAASAALNIPIQSYCPPVLRTEFVTGPFSRVVCGRNVRESATADVIIMWTQCNVPLSAADFRPNHFVLLTPLSNTPTECVQIVERSSDVGTPKYESTFVIPSNMSFDSPTATSSPVIKCGGICTQSQENDIKDKDLDHAASITSSSGELENKNLSVENLIYNLQNCSEPLTRIPNGKKEQKYFIVANSENKARREINKHSRFCDDCGSWNSVGAATVKSSYLVAKSDLTVKTIKIKDGVCHDYCKGAWLPMEQQPEKSQILILCRSYYKLKRAPEYRRRITWIDTCPTSLGIARESAIVEYTGKFPNCTGSHGNARTNGCEYVRTDPRVFKEIDVLSKSNRPKQIYNQMILDDSECAPRNLQQIKNRKRKNPDIAQVCKKRNLADEFQEVLSMVQDSLFVQEVFVSGGKPPSVVVHLDESLDDIRKFCSTGSASLGIDRTFNLGQCFVTITVYKNLHVLRRTTQDHPIFIGPMFLHWDGSYGTYHKFLSYLRVKLDQECNTAVRCNDQLTIGSDDEKALVKALYVCFPSANHLLCMVHLEENTRRLLADKLGVGKRQREDLVRDVFKALPQSDDSVAFLRQADEIEDKYQAELPDFVQYFRNRLRPAIEKHVIVSNSGSTVCWTNNNCESMNHILKLACNWTPQKLPELIRKLEAVVRAQVQEVRRALHGQGDFVLAPLYSKFNVKDMDWKSLNDEQKRDRLRQLHEHKPRVCRNKEDVVESGDGKLKVPCGQRLARKPGQVKRPRNAKTVTR